MVKRNLLVFSHFTTMFTLGEFLTFETMVNVDSACCLSMLSVKTDRTDQRDRFPERVRRQASSSVCGHPRETRAWKKKTRVYFRAQILCNTYARARAYRPNRFRVYTTRVNRKVRRRWWSHANEQSIVDCCRRYARARNKTAQAREVCGPADTADTRRSGGNSGNWFFGHENVGRFGRTRTTRRRYTRPTTIVTLPRSSGGDRRGTATAAAAARTR